MSTDIEFVEAEAILWELNKIDSTNFTIITSEYWLNSEEVEMREFEGDCLLPKEDDSENN